MFLRSLSLAFPAFSIRLIEREVDNLPFIPEIDPPSDIRIDTAQFDPAPETAADITEIKPNPDSIVIDPLTIDKVVDLLTPEEQDDQISNDSDSTDAVIYAQNDLESALNGQALTREELEALTEAYEISQEAANAPESLSY